MASNDAISTIERLVATDVGRGIGPMAEYCTGSLARAARSIVDAGTPRVAILTGFFIAAARPPLAETDGPIGAVALAVAIKALGGEARIVTDDNCVPAVRSAARGFDIPIDSAPVGDGYSEWEPIGLDLTHVISVERVGPALDGRKYNMRGIDISDYTAPLERIFTGSWTTIGIGDGGNELGMGVIPRDLVVANVKNGDKIHCVVGCDHLIVAGTSNWGAAGLVAALRLTTQRGTAELDRILDPDWSRACLDRMVADRTAVDGPLRTISASVDGIPWPQYAEILERVTEIAKR
jgi:hypothetical protein